ncbi:MAG: glycosyltransferase family 2 protein [Verrucomicrobia bacterium]|nr:glycosyltransferase family 2 protein [Verrucomicrobiota bacterium]
MTAPDILHGQVPTRPPPAGGAGTPEVSLLVSCRNEEANIERCIREVARVLPAAEILIIDGGTDRTIEIARTLQQEFPGVVPIKNIGDRGKGHAIKTGIARASAPVMAQFDCDLQFFADDLPALLSPVVSGAYDLALGSRFLQGSDRSAYRSVFFRDAGNRLLSLFISLLIGRRVTDVTAGVKAWTRDAIRQIDFRDDRYSYEAEMVVRAASLRLRFCEIPVRYADRAAGVSMHRNSAAVIKAGAVIMAKALQARLR